MMRTTIKDENVVNFILAAFLRFTSNLPTFDTGQWFYRVFTGFYWVSLSFPLVLSGFDEF